MPKITVHGGPSNAAEPIARPGEGVFFQATPEAEPESTVDGDPPVPATEGGEQPSPGTSSSTSSPSTEKSSASPATLRRRPARTTASPSRQDPAESSTAPPATSSGPAIRGPQDTAD